MVGSDVTGDGNGVKTVVGAGWGALFGKKVEISGELASLTNIAAHFTHTSPQHQMRTDIPPWGAPRHYCKCSSFLKLKL